MLRPPTRLVPFLAVPLILSGCEVETDGGAESETGIPATAEARARSTDLDAEEQAIRARVQAWQEAANTSAEAFASFYAPDGVLMAPNAPAAEGPDAIARAMAPVLETVDEIRFEPITIEVAASGDLAVERGRYVLAGTAPDGTAFDDEGSYLVAWEKHGGQWMVLQDIFNSDRPAPGGEEQ